MGRSGGDERVTFLERFMEISPDLLCVMDEATRPIALSRSFEDVLGWPLDELSDQPLIEMVHPDDLATVVDQLGVVLQGGRSQGTEMRMRRRDGTYVWVQAAASADRESGQVYVTAVDLTARKDLEATLRRQLELEEIVSATASRLIGTEPEDVPAAITDALAQLATGLGAHRGHFLRGSQHRDDVVYLEWYDPHIPQAAHVPSDEPDVRRWWSEALRSRRVLRLDDVADLRDEAPEVVAALEADSVRSLLHIPLPPHRRFWGFLTFSSVLEPVSFSDAAVHLMRLAGECFLAALASGDDAAALDDARRELEHRNEELERTNEELERFAYAAAHDLKAPLARIEMALSAAPATPGPQSDLLGIARRGAARMRQLIEDLLTFAAVGQARGERSDVDLDEVLDLVLADLEPVVADVEARVERPAPLPGVRGSRPLLGQLLQNLVANALKFVRPDRAPVVRVMAAAEDGGVRLTVVDNGIGIAPADRTKVFGVFTRLNPDDAFHGSGVGLATCARVAQHHGGRIWIDDGLDGGTAVHVWLPGAEGVAGDGGPA